MYLRIRSRKPPYQVGGALRQTLELDAWAGEIDDRYLEFKDVERVHAVFRAPPVRVVGAIRQADEGCVVEYRLSWYSALIWICVFGFSTFFVMNLKGLLPVALLLAFLATFLTELVRIHVMLRSIATRA